MTKRLSIIILTAIISILACNAKTNVNIVFIGNRITEGALLDNPDTQSPPAQAVRFIQNNTDTEVRFINCGYGGRTTVDFLPDTGFIFGKVTEASDGLAAHQGMMVFSISLGTNDSACRGPLGAPVVPQQYYTNMKVIIDRLLTRYPGSIVVIQYPLWYSPNTYNGAEYLLEGQKRLQTYYPEIDRLVELYSRTHPGRVTSGSKDAYGQFRDNSEALFVHESGNAGIFYLHPNATGAELLGEYWGRSIINATKLKYKK